MSYIDVKNKKGTVEKNPPSGYGSWLGFWESEKGKKSTSCEVSGCNNSAVLGGHVIKSGGYGKEYILPMCHSCNNKEDGEIFEAWESDLVSVK